MADKNGYQGLAAKYREVMDAAMENADRCLLSDWETSLPYLRQALLGHREGTALVLPHSLRVVRRPLEIVVAIQTEQFESVARYPGQQLNEILEQINTDLEHRTGPWQMTYQAEQRMLQKSRIS